MGRLARHTVEALELAQLLREPGCRLVGLSETIDTGSAFGTFFYTVLAALDQMERDQIAERTRMALAHRAAQGARLGAAPTGWRKVRGRDGKETGLAVDPTGQRLVYRLRELRDGGLTETDDGADEMRVTVHRLLEVAQRAVCKEPPCRAAVDRSARRRR
ncbi:MAG: recombinase family protein [Candidatus Riflebacteria bacterium]|nr:recombinase family protein [Candidatus Riflebacteria bacterium]